MNSSTFGILCYPGSLPYKLYDFCQFSITSSVKWTCKSISGACCKDKIRCCVWFSAWDIVNVSKRESYYCFNSSLFKWWWCYYHFALSQSNSPKKKKKSNIPSPSENKKLTLVGLHMLQPGIWGGVWILVGQLLHSVQDNSDPQEGTQIPNVFEGDELNTDPKNLVTPGV